MLVRILKYVLLFFFFTLITLMIMLNGVILCMWNVFHFMSLPLNAFSYIKYYTIMWGRLNILDTSHHPFNDGMFLICFSCVINCHCTWEIRVTKLCICVIKYMWYRIRSLLLQPSSLPVPQAITIVTEKLRCYSTAAAVMAIIRLPVWAPSPGCFPKGLLEKLWTWWGRDSTIYLTVVWITLLTFECKHFEDLLLIRNSTLVNLLCVNSFTFFDSKHWMNKYCHKVLVKNQPSAFFHADCDHLMLNKYYFYISYCI